MAQRPRNSTNNTNADSNIEGCLNKLLKREKLTQCANNAKQSPVPKCTRDRSTTRPRTTGSTSPSLGSPNVKLRPISLRQQNAPLLRTKAPASASADVIHSELLTDGNAKVEVTVKKTRGLRNQHHRSNSEIRSREPWDKLLKIKKSEELSSFSNYDPLRTIHFLAKELQSKMQVNAPNDEGVQKIILDMQYALNRVPPEVASTIHLQDRDLEGTCRRRSNSEIREKSKKNTKILMENAPVLKPKMLNTYCQTTENNHSETAKLQKQLEASTQILETSCKQMEQVCSRLKTEKQELELLLRAEKETVKFLRKHIEELEVDKEEANNAVIKQLNDEKHKLNLTIKKLQKQLETEFKPTAQELKGIINDLRIQKHNTEQENLSLRHQLTLANMEKEKYIAILSVRDKQINEIRNEMTQLQEVVNEQLQEFKRTPIPSSPSSQTSVLESEPPSWQKLLTKDTKIFTEKSENLTPSSVNTDESELHNLFIKDHSDIHSFRDLQSPNSSGTSTVIHEMQENGMLDHLKLRAPDTKNELYHDVSSVQNSVKKAYGITLKKPAENTMKTSVKDIFEEFGLGKKKYHGNALVSTTPQSVKDGNYHTTDASIIT